MRKTPQRDIRITTSSVGKAQFNTTGKYVFDMNMSPIKTMRMREDGCPEIKSPKKI
jgi:hypothetical protein